MCIEVEAKLVVEEVAGGKVAGGGGRGRRDIAERGVGRGRVRVVSAADVLAWALLYFISHIFNTPALGAINAISGQRALGRPERATPSSSPVSARRAGARRFGDGGCDRYTCTGVARLKSGDAGLRVEAEGLKRGRVSVGTDSASELWEV